ncbi:hypothetical protein KSC_044190 [Ktedonobacter sp. SOSP1-52]|nr:hypothetical protein KSC_044190 [Ktedonobacter sp. SOSP1-52]
MNWTGFHVSCFLSIIRVFWTRNLHTSRDPLQRARTSHAFASPRESLHLISTDGQTGRRGEWEIIGGSHPLGLLYFEQEACRLEY